MRAVPVTVTAAMLVTALPSAVPAQEAVLAYQRAIAQVCQKKITAEMTRLYQEALKEMQATRYGRGENSNFFGLRSPERALQRLRTSPGHGAPLISPTRSARPRREVVGSTDSGQVARARRVAAHANTAVREDVRSDPTRGPPNAILAVARKSGGTQPVCPRPLRLRG